jgi:hypothetical protein
MVSFLLSLLGIIFDPQIRKLIGINYVGSKIVFPNIVLLLGLLVLINSLRDIDFLLGIQLSIRGVLFAFSDVRLGIISSLNVASRGVFGEKVSLFR